MVFSKISLLILKILNKFKTQIKLKKLYLTKLQCNKIKYHQDRILKTPLDIHFFLQNID